jgi:hypothetical protein
MAEASNPVDPLHTQSMAEVVANMSPTVQQMYADYIAILKDDCTVGCDERIMHARHNMVNEIHAELLQAQLAKIEKE